VQKQCEFAVRHCQSQITVVVYGEQQCQHQSLAQKAHVLFEHYKRTRTFFVAALTIELES